MRLIDADALKEAIQTKEEVNEETWEQLYDSVMEEIDNAPTVEPDNALREFAKFVRKWVLNEDFEEDYDIWADAFAEVACRKLVKLGLVKLDGDTYKEADNE